MLNMVYIYNNIYNNILAINRTRIIIEILHNVIATCMQYFSNIAAIFKMY